jgi:glutaredoxin
MGQSLHDAPVTRRASRRAWDLAALAMVLLAWMLPAGPARAERAPPAAAEAVEIEVFVRDGCPHCADAKVFLEKLRQERPGLVVTLRHVIREPESLRRLEALMSRTPGGAVSVPAFVIRGELLVGFVDEATSGARIREMVAGPAPAAAGDGGGKCPIGEELPCADASTTPDPGIVTLPWIDRRISLDDLGLPVFTIVIGLLDGFNPCSMWVLVLMISMLAAVGDRRRMLAVAGTFVAVQGIAYFAFMAAWLNLFLLIGLSRASEIVLGAIALVAGLINVKDFLAFGRGVTLSIPKSAKPGIYQRMRGLMNEERLAVAIGGTVVLGILVQLVELVCTSGLPALYTRILTLRQLDPWTYYGYLLLYNLMYMVDDVMILAIGVVTLSRHRLQEKEGRVLKLLSGLVMLGLGIYLIV